MNPVLVYDDMQQNIAEMSQSLIELLLNGCSGRRSILLRLWHTLFKGDGNMSPYLNRENHCRRKQ